MWTAARITVPLVLLAWIARQTLLDPEHPEAIPALWAQPRDNRWLVAAVVAYFSAICITFVRWYLLVRALRLPFRLRDAMRLGFIGYVLQFLSFGSVGGDLFKAVFLAREQPARRPEAVATIFLDRAVGMLGLMLLICTAFLGYGWSRLSTVLQSLAVSCFLGAAVGVILVASLLWTQATTAPLRRALRRFPRVCAVLLRGEHSLHLYRTHRIAFVATLGLAFTSHFCLTLSAYGAARTLWSDAPRLGEQLVIWNVASSVGTLPLSPGGLGTLEAAYSFLYQTVPLGGRPLEQGFAVALLLRLVTLIVAGLGVVVYWFSRRDLRQMADEAPTRLTTPPVAGGHSALGDCSENQR